MKIEKSVEEVGWTDRECCVIAIIIFIMLVVMSYIFEKEVLELCEFLKPLDIFYK